MLRSSGCICLPSQRTLRDYTYFLDVKHGFSHEIDAMLYRDARVASCELREKYTLLLLDEMHIREHLVYDKHSGEVIGYVNLGDINQHLLEFERIITSEQDRPPQLAKTMMVLMVRGLFNSLQFPYVQFPCSEITGELLYDPFWEAVKRIENVGLKVIVNI